MKARHIAAFAPIALAIIGAIACGAIVIPLVRAIVASRGALLVTLGG